jgi:hypothetical protein
MSPDFTGAPSPFGTDRLGGGVAGAGIKPARQDPPRQQRRRFAGQINEHALRDVLGELAIPVDHSQSRRIHQIHVAPNQLGKGRLATALGESLE